MITFDTNLLVRLVTNDDQKQADIAENLLSNNEVFIPRTVLMETEWVLRSVYKFPRSDIADFLDNALNVENLFLENSTEVALAIDWYKLGADFADALHLSVCDNRMMHTFDANFCKSAGRLGITPAFKVI
jgi:predicted nucleic-acid-binding protein